LLCVLSAQKTANDNKARDVGTIIRSLGLNPTEAQLSVLLKAMEDPARSGSSGYIQFARLSDVVYNCMVIKLPFALQKDDEERVFQAFRVS
jgi:Ca2+-binding EF-hand superfamily protein